MLQFICLFIPTIISVGITSYLQKKKIDLPFFVLCYFSYLVFINYLIFILIYLNNRIEQELVLLNTDDFTYLLFSIKYLSFAILLAIVLPFVVEILRNNFKINLTFKRK